MSKVLVIGSGYYDDTEGNINITSLKDGDVLSVTYESSYYAGLGIHYKNTQYLLNNTPCGVMDKTSELRNGLQDHIEKQLIKQGYTYTLKTLGKKLIFTLSVENNVIKTIKEKLDITTGGLSYCTFEKIINNVITVTYHGHEVGGSYVSESSVTPGYVKLLEFHSNSRVKFIKRRSGGIGSDVYVFDVYIDEPILDEIPEGLPVKIYGNVAFRWGLGKTEAQIISLIDGVKNGKLTNIKLIDNHVIYGDVKLFEITQHVIELNKHFNGHNTHWTRDVYDVMVYLLIDKDILEELYFKILKENYECDVRMITHECSTPTIRYYSDEPEELKYGYLPNKNI